MEAFSLSGANGWQLLSTLLDADATFSGKYTWTFLSIKNTHATQNIIVKTKPGSTAPSTDSGVNLLGGAAGAGQGFVWDVGDQGTPIDGKAVWIKCSGAATTFDITFIRKGS